ncbi:Gfo/Idh/MocA family protein [Mammaliicoccus sciuri]|uniref:Gfo/Idh/MocA family protein n=1 Tax=Mammaliicoccus sciuri TaxID=1296 RepID=UPI001FB21EE5|nr:Gfo/Idh/MocA family oxidoreductase [Mammaliicoccus sciuri]MCJ0925136.1 Gfo/Idh/MocA family oxidoreductase [Mammaliicoccus sciuri]UXV29585.1 Gfo/Idh/MocA family oxidoreductase [Mammaliicoccus sciuri]
MKQINYGVIGAGYFGKELARILSKIENAKVVSVYDVDNENSKSLAQEVNCDFDEDLEVICSRTDIDAIIIASPNGYHKESALLAAKHKKHIFCEKPIALNYKDCFEMIEAAKQNNVFFMAGHVMNFMDGVRRIKQFINDGEIGDVLFCHAERNGWEEPQETISWKKKRDISGGHLYHHIHELDFIQFIMGSAKQATMVGGNVAHNGEQFGDEDDMLLITLEFENNRYATLQYGSAFRWSDHYVKIQGTKGAILIDLQDVKVVLRKNNEDKQFLLHRSKEEDEDRTNIYKGSKDDGAIMYGNPNKKPPLWLQGIMEREMVYLHELLNGKEVSEEFKPLVDGTAAMSSIATADALTISKEENRKVKIEEVVANDN